MLITSIPQYVSSVTNAKMDLGATTLLTLFTAPSNADLNSSIVNSILVSNEDTSNASTITVTLVGSGLDDNGATTSTHIYPLFKDKAVAAKTTIELLTRDLVLKSGEILKVQAADADRLFVIASIQQLSKVRASTSDTNERVIAANAGY